MTTLLTLAPVKLATSSMALTVPATEEWTGAETKASVAPMTWPTADLVPHFHGGSVGGADVLGQGDDYLVRNGGRGDGLAAGQLLVVRGVDAADEGLVTL